MNTTLLSKSARNITLASTLLLMAGCAAQKKPAPAPPPHHPAPTSQCPANLPKHIVSLTQGYAICLPANVHAGSASGLPAGSFVYTGFSVPAGTNLERKQLNIQPGSDDNLQSATPFGHLTAGGVTFQRMKEGDAGAGHREEHIIYIWTHAGKKLYFDFGLYSVNPGVFDPPNRPKEFNEPAQVHSTEEIMRTFSRVH